MILHLSIQNYALIRHLELDFDRGFSVITGETGAGKSILLGALDLILGKRADTQVLHDQSAKCIVEGVFNVDGLPLDGFFKNYDLDHEPRTLLRREINPHGKSRAFINDTPVKLSVLSALGEQLVDIHSQHQSLALTDSDFQISILDAYAGLQRETAAYRQVYDTCKEKEEQLATLKEQQQKSRNEKDYYGFLVGELEAASIRDGEQEQIEEELAVLEHAEEIRSVLFRVKQLMENERGGVVPGMQEMELDLSKIRNFNPLLEELGTRIESVRIEVQDIQQELERFEAQVEVDPERTLELQERMSTLYGLMQKHRVTTGNELLAVMQDINRKLESIENLEDLIGKSEQELQSLKKILVDSAAGISKKRLQAIDRFQKEVSESFPALGLANAVFQVERSQLEEPGKDGVDLIRFLFNANKGAALHDVSKVASGGEKSRLMLALKSLISKKALLPTIIFDEIDTGVSGAVADRVGEILLSLADSMQVISITHLPQIAGKGKHHYQVYKTVSENHTSTHVKKLNPDERIIEIAKLLSGQEVTNASVESARQLLDNESNPSRYRST